jgi:tetratricopeptide (TPR) repeat protein
MKSVSKSIFFWLIGIISFALLAAATQSMVHPGQSAMILVQRLGVEPLASFSNPLYGWVVQAIALVAGSSAFHAINLFSALCAAGVLMMVFAFVYRATRTFNIDNSFSAPVMHRAQTAAGVVSVLYLLATTPFWMAATRANPIMFDLLLLFTAFYLVISFNEKSSMMRMYLAVLLYGVTIVEFNTAILIAPLFAILVVTQMYHAESFTGGNLAKTFWFGVIGLTVYLIQAGVFMATPAYEWREFNHYFQVIWYIWLEQYQTLTGGLPRVGWLTIALVSVLPLLITAAMRIPGGATRARGALFGASVLNMILGVLAILTLRDFPLAPTNLTGTARLFITPYVLIGLWVGNVVAFWLVVLFRQKRFERPAGRAVRRVSGYVIMAVAPAYLVFTMVTQSFPGSRDPANRTIQRFAVQAVDQAVGKEWLVTATPLDDLIALEVYRRDIPLKVLRLSYGRSPAHMKYVAQLFSDDARLESLARIGMAPLLEEWFGTITNAEQVIAVVHVPDLWLEAGMEAIPDRVLFLGAATHANIPVDALLEQARAFWEDYGNDVLNTTPGSELNQTYLAWIKMHLSKIANNLGVFLEDRGRPDDAYRCYEKARMFAPENLSALMNLHVLAQRQDRSEFDALEQELVQRTENMMGKIQTTSLAYHYGFVRVPELFAKRGLAFAMSGKARLAISDMKRALALREGNPQLQMALATLYFGQDMNEESKESYQAVLDKDPKNTGARVGLMRVSSRQGDYGEARRHLQQLKDMGVSASALAMEEAVIESLSGSPAKALLLMQHVAKEQPENMQVWAAIAVTASELKDNKTAETAMEQLAKAKVVSPAIQLVMAQSALNQGDRGGARRLLNEVLKRQPGNIHALEMKLRIDISERAREEAQKTVETILRYDSRNALANYMLGVHHMYKEEYALAESAYRASLAAFRGPEALNDLAYVLSLQNKLSEAEPLARESLHLNDRNSAAWDTLGVILMKQDKLPEAEEALQASLALRPGAAGVMLSLAMLHEKRGRLEEAGNVMREVSTRMNELTPQDQAVFRDLQFRLQNRS